MDNEHLAELYIGRAVAFASQSDRSLWAAGIYAARIVGTYAEAGTRAIADRAGRDVSSVENWAHAWEMYTALRELIGATQARALRASLTIGHFWTAWELRRKYGKSVGVVAGWLVHCLWLKSTAQPYSAAVMRSEIDAELDGTRGLVTWSWIAPRLLAMVQDVITADGAPRDVVNAAQKIQKFYGVKMQNLVSWVLAQRTADGGVFARNDFQASAIVNGLRLWEVQGHEKAMLKRLKLYRDWRNSGIFGTSTGPCFEKARRGEKLPVDEMFTGAQLSEKESETDEKKTEAETD